MIATAFVLPLAFEKLDRDSSGTEGSDVAVAALKKLEDRLQQAAQRRSERLATRCSRKRARAQNSDSPNKTQALLRAERNAIYECRMIAAAAKREQRAIDLARAAHQLNLIRQQRRQAAHEHRVRIVGEFVISSIPPISALEDSGLLDGSSETIEKLMMSDPVNCAHCNKKEDLRKKVCPVSNDPHYRRLVVLSKAVLDCVSSAHLSLKRNLVINPDSFGSDNMKVPHPSLLVRAVHAASCRPCEVNDDELHLAAIDVATALRSLRSGVLELHPQCTETTGGSSTSFVKLLLSFHHKFHRWVKVMNDSERVTRGAKSREALKDQMIETILKLEAAQAFRLADIAEKPTICRAGIAEKRVALTGAIETQIQQLVADLKAIAGDTALSELCSRRLLRSAQPNTNAVTEIHAP